MNQQVKSKRKSRQASNRRTEQEHRNEPAFEQKTATSYKHKASDDGQMGMMQEWDYQKVKEVVSAVYVLASLFMTKDQKDRVDQINKDVSAILGVRTLADWVPPQPLLNVIGLSAGEAPQQFRKAA